MVTRGNTFFLTWLNWALLDNVGDRETRRMITAQQLLHGLTGGDAKRLTHAAHESARKLILSLHDASDSERNEKLCAIGFAIHLIGDSFAHRFLDGDTVTYATGSGHAAHGTMPDHVFRDGTGLGHLHDYMKRLSALEGASGLPASSTVAELHGHLEPLASESDGSSLRVRELAARKKLHTVEKWSSLGPHAPRKHESESCQKYVDLLLSRLRLNGSGAPIARWAERGLRCKKVWTAFRDAAEPAFGEAGLCKDDGFRTSETLPVGCEKGYEFVDPES